MLQHKSPIAALVVESMWVPLAEMMIGPLVCRMVEVVSPRIDRQLVEQLRIEPGGFEHGRIGVTQQFKPPGNDFVVAPGGHSRAGDKPRDWSHPLLRIGLDLLGRVQHCHGAITEKIVQPLQGTGHDPLGFIPRPPLGQHRFGHAANEERPQQFAVR